MKEAGLNKQTIKAIQDVPVVKDKAIGRQPYPHFSYEDDYKGIKQAAGTKDKKIFLVDDDKNKAIHEAMHANFALDFL